MTQTMGYGTRVHKRQLRGHWLGAVLAVVVIGSLTSCSARFGADDDESPKQKAPSIQLQAWSQLHSESYEIPERALRSYAYAAAVMEKTTPGCGIGWPTLAAIGGVSSNHGSAAQASVDEHGQVSPILRDLDAANPKGKPAIADTDAGQYDGNSEIDQTMGPMQVGPSRWEQYATDANNDGKADPDNFDDAALTVARFLCATGGDLKNTDGWVSAVSQFNATPGFLEKVHAKASMYGR